MDSLEWLGRQEPSYIAIVLSRAVSKIEELHGLPYNPEFKRKAQQFVVDMPLQAIGFCSLCNAGLCGHCGKCHFISPRTAEPCKAFVVTIPEECWEWKEAYAAIATVIDETFDQDS